MPGFGISIHVGSAAKAGNPSWGVLCSAPADVPSGPRILATPAARPVEVVWSRRNRSVRHSIQQDWLAGAPPPVILHRLTAMAGGDWWDAAATGMTSDAPSPLSACHYCRGSNF